MNENYSAQCLVTCTICFRQVCCVVCVEMFCKLG